VWHTFEVCHTYKKRLPTPEAGGLEMKNLLKENSVQICERSIPCTSSPHLASQEKEPVGIGQHILYFHIRHYRSPQDLWDYAAETYQ
jgi:hypothetical protein